MEDFRNPYILNAVASKNNGFSLISEKMKEPLDIKKYPGAYFFILAPSRSGHTFVTNMIQSWISNSCLINLENFDPINFTVYLEDLDMEVYERSTKIICLRDLLNWLASYTKFMWIIKDKKFNEPLINIKNIYWVKERTPKLEKDPNIVFIPNYMDKEEFMDLKYREKSTEEKINGGLNAWLRIAKEFTGDTNFMKGFSNLYYDNFVSSEKYRKEICKKIGGNFSDNLLNIIPFNGNHSSFDKGFQGRAQEMNVLERYKYFNDIEIHKKSFIMDILKNHEALDFYINNFNISEDQIKFIDSI